MDLKLLDEIEKRPGVFLGERTLTALAQYIQGFSFAHRFYEVKEEDEFAIVWGNFNHWVAQKLGSKESTSGWCRMILEVSENEDEAFDTFFELLKQKEVEVRLRKASER